MPVLAPAAWLAAILVAIALPSLAAPPETPFGRYHALVIGNNDYRSLPRLQTAVADAEAVSEVLRQRYNFEVRLLRNASRSDILRALNDYRAELTESDNLLIYYAGHGYVDRQTDTGFWQPVDAEADDDLNWIANADLTRRLNAMTARHVLVVADSCYSGTLVRAATGEIPTGRERDTWLKRLSEKRSRTAIVSGGIEPVADSGRGGHSVFAAALLDALHDNEDYVEGSVLFQRISRPVVVNADQTPEYSDIRNAGHEGGEFIFVPTGTRPSVAAAEPAAPATGGPTRGGGDNAAEVAFWQSIQEGGKAEDFGAYLQQYPAGVFAPLARSRLAALQAAGQGTSIAGNWISERQIYPFDKDYEYQLVFEFRVIGNRLLGSLTWEATPESKRKYPNVKRAITEGSIDGNVVSFIEPFEVMMGSATQSHKRQYTGEIKGGAIVMFVQDTLGNPPREFTVSRAAQQ